MVISTRRDTKKFYMMEKNPSVSLLVHDFDAKKSELADETVGKYTITLNGEACIETGEVAEKYRAIHSLNNAGYEQFIQGAEIAIITIRVSDARVCDVNDRVRFWSRKESEPGAFGTRASSQGI